MLALTTSWALLTILISAVFGCIIYLKWSLSYWERKGMPTFPASLPFGNIKPVAMQKIAFGVGLKLFYFAAKAAGYKHLGLYSFWKASYMPLDPQVVKNIISKDFYYFLNRPIYHNAKDDPISAHIFSVSGPKWRNIRVKLTPTFTTGKMKVMLPLLVQSGNKLVEASNDFIGLVDIKDILGKYTLDTIASCAFGLDCNAFKSSGSDFQKYLVKMLQTNSYDQFKFLFGTIFPDFARALHLVATPQDVANFYLKVIKETVEYREKNNVQRNDFLQLLINLKDSGENGGLKIEEIAAHSFLFLQAGFETTAITITFCLYELSINPDIQDRLREEITDVLLRHNNEVTYEAIVEMKYLGQVIDETLRKYPALPFISRQCVADYKIPNTNFVLQKGCVVNVPLLGFHYDPEYFEDPEKFKPDRFSDENKRKIVPFTYLPFGEGPRNCIGNRFGLLQIKIALVSLLKNFSFSLNGKTKTPFEYDPHNLFMTVLGKMWLDIQKLPVQK